jgi:membrane protease YdiL (CAAX protease family)
MAASETTDARVDGGSAGRAIGVALLLGLGGPLLAIVLSLPTAVVVRAFGLPLFVAVGLFLLTGQYLAFGGWALLYLYRRGLDLDGIREYLGVDVPSIRDLLVVLGGWALIFASVVVIGIVVQVLGAPTAENQTGQLVEADPSLIPPLILAMFLVVGPCEEILYRGVVQGRLRESFGPAPSIVIASAIFALVHWVALTGGATGRLVTVAILFFPSLVFGAVYEYTENLVVPILVHAIHNSVLLALFYLALRFGGEAPAIL